MSGKNNIDKLVSDKLASQQLPMSEAHWRSTQSFILAKKRKSRRIAALWFVAFFLVSSLGYLAWKGSSEDSGATKLVGNGLNDNQEEILKTGQQPGISKEASDSSKKVVSQRNQKAKVENDALNEISETSGSSITVETDYTIAIDSAEDLSKADSVNASKRMSLSINLTTDSSEYSKGSNDFSATGVFKSTIESSIIIKSGSRESESATDIVSGIAILNDQKQDRNEDSVLILTYPKDSLNLSDKGKVFDDGPEMTEMVISPVTNKDTVLPFDSSIVVIPDTAGQVLVTESDDSLQLQVDTITEDQNWSGGGLLLLPYFGTSISFRRLSGSDHALLEKRNREEQSPFTIDLGVRARYGFSNGWSPALTVESIFTEGATDTVSITTSGGAVYSTGCIANKWIFMADSEDRRNRAFSLVMAALASGKKVSFWYSSSTCAAWNYHQGTSVKLIK